MRDERHKHVAPSPKPCPYSVDLSPLSQLVLLLLLLFSAPSQPVATYAEVPLLKVQPRENAVPRICATTTTAIPSFTRLLRTAVEHISLLLSLCACVCVCVCVCVRCVWRDEVSRKPLRDGGSNQPAQLSSARPVRCAEREREGGWCNGSAKAKVGNPMAPAEYTQARRHADMQRQKGMRERERTHGLSMMRDTTMASHCSIECRRLQRLDVNSACGGGGKSVCRQSQSNTDTKTQTQTWTHGTCTSPPEGVSMVAVLLRALSVSVAPGGESRSPRKPCGAVEDCTGA